MQVTAREAVQLVLEIRDRQHMNLLEYFFTMTPPLTPCESLLELSLVMVYLLNAHLCSMVLFLSCITAPLTTNHQQFVSLHL